MNAHAMNADISSDAYGALSEPATLTIKRRLPGPIERVWSYLTDGELRRKWLAAGELKQEVGATVEFVWRNEEISDPPGKRPAGHAEEHRMACSVTEIDPPRKLAITWGRSAGVTFELEPVGDAVLLTVTHRRLPDRESLVNVSAGWHAHLDALAQRLSGEHTMSFWDGWTNLRAEYEQRIPS